MKVSHTLLVLAACCVLNTACFVSVPSSAETAKPADTKSDSKSDAKSDSKSDSKSDAKTTGVNDADNNIFTHQVGGIRFEKPEGWTHEADGDVITMLAPDHTMSIAISVAQSDNLDKAVNELQTELSNVMKNIETDGKPQKTDVNGMETYTVSGKGTIDGTPVFWAVDLVQARRPVFVITFGRQGEWDKHKDEYGEFARSVQKI